MQFLVNKSKFLIKIKIYKQLWPCEKTVLGLNFQNFQNKVTALL